MGNGATLGGTGTVGAITVTSGGTVAPGDTPRFLPPPNDLGDGVLTAASANFSTRRHPGDPGSVQRHGRHDL